MTEYAKVATKQKAFWQFIRDKNVHFGGITLLGLVFSIGGCVFTFNPQTKNIATTPLALGGGMLLLHGLSMQINQTSEDMIDNLIEIIAKEN